MKLNSWRPCNRLAIFFSLHLRALRRTPVDSAGLSIAPYLGQCKRFTAYRNILLCKSEIVPLDSGCPALIAIYYTICLSSAILRKSSETLQIVRCKHSRPEQQISSEPLPGLCVAFGSWKPIKGRICAAQCGHVTAS